MASDEKVVERIEEDAPFDVAPFDEKEYIRKELISFRTTAVLFVFSILVAGITFLVWRYTHLRFSILVLLALAIGILLLRFIFKATRIDISHWKRREWIGTMFLYFFFWLGFILLFVNPPFTDAASPKIEVAAHPASQRPGGEVQLGAYVADNTGIAGPPQFCVHRFEGDTPPRYEQLSEAERTACSEQWERLEGRPFWHDNGTFPEGRYAIYVVAQDQSGQSASYQGGFNVSSPFSVSLPRDNKFINSEDALTVRVHADLFVRAVQFSLDGGTTWSNFELHPDPAKAADHYWRTEPRYEGWTAGTHNVTLRVALQPTYMRHEDHVLRGAAEDPNGPYTLTVDPGLPEIGTKKVDYGRGRTDFPEFGYHNPAQTPGLGVPALLLGLVGLVVAGRRRAA